MESNNLRGNELLRAAINQILAHPETWNQRDWHCGTRHCFGGWCQVKAGEKETDYAVKSDLARNAGIPVEDVEWLCSGLRTLSELHAYVKARLDGKADPLADGYGRDGYDSDGYDRDGYGRRGYDRDGYDRSGYGRDGYGRSGYDREGYDRDGYDRAKNRLQPL